MFGKQETPVLVMQTLYAYADEMQIRLWSIKEIVIDIANILFHRCWCCKQRAALIFFVVSDIVFFYVCWCVFYCSVSCYRPSPSGVFIVFGFVILTVLCLVVVALS